MNGNIFNNIPQAITVEIFEELLNRNNIRIERILSKGQCSDKDFWYDQSENEWVILIKGSAVLEFENGLSTLVAGDYINIPAHQKHRVQWTDPNVETIWLALFY